MSNRKKAKPAKPARRGSRGTPPQPPARAVRRVPLTEYDLTELRLKYAHRRSVTEGLKWVAYILAAWIPLQPIQNIFQDLAGKDTNLNVAISISLAYSAVSTVGWAITGTHSRRRKTALRTLRAQLSAAQGRVRSEMLDDLDQGDVP